MKGLLLKDFYMMMRYCKAYLLVVLGFMVLSVTMRNNILFVCYLGVFSSMIPVTLMSYDEHSKWTVYSETLPYSKAQLVSVKYVMGLLIHLVVAVVTGTVLTAKMYAESAFTVERLTMLLAALLLLPLLFAAVMLPFMFKLGVEKGRIIFAVSIGFAISVSIIVSSYLEDTGRVLGGLTAAALVIIALYAGSWLLSVAIYQKREIR